jgi:hypothetical protein
MSRRTENSTSTAEIFKPNLVSPGIAFGLGPEGKRRAPDRPPARYRRSRHPGQRRYRLSWFGTILPGIGLHSYGFAQTGFLWPAAFAATSLFL